MSKLLPPNSTKFERNVTDVTSKNTDLPVDIKTLSSIDQAPDQFLSFLAWQYSVDSWDPDWQPSLQRQLIKKSFRQLNQSLSIDCNLNIFNISNLRQRY